MVRFLFALSAAFLIFLRAALFCFGDAMFTSPTLVFIVLFDATSEQSGPTIASIPVQEIRQLLKQTTGGEQPVLTSAEAARRSSALTNYFRVDGAEAATVYRWTVRLC